MDKLLPIVEGCDAILINCKCPENKGFVKVGKCLGKVANWKGERRWGVDRLIHGTKGATCFHVNEDCLMRIDGNEDQFREEENVKLLEHIK